MKMFDLRIDLAAAVLPTATRARVRDAVTTGLVLDYNARRLAAS